jgi:predicted GNAT family acetyltransferase
MGERPEFEIVDNPGEARFEAWLAGQRVGLLAYRDLDRSRMFTHTEVDPAFEGRGVGSALARTALEESRVQERHVVPLCPFVRGYIEHHQEYADLETV